MMDHPQEITDTLREARREFVRTDAMLEYRMDACQKIRHAILALDLNIEPELWERRYLTEVLYEAELCLQSLEGHRDVVSGEVIRHHRSGTTADNFINFCRTHIFSMRQRSEIFTES